MLEKPEEVEKRILEHRKAVRFYDRNNAIATHCWENDHIMDFDNTRLVYKSNNVKRRRTVEGVLINSIPTVSGNKPFVKLDNINNSHVIRENDLSEFVIESNEAPFPEVIPPTPPSPTLTSSQAPPPRQAISEDNALGSIFVQDAVAAPPGRTGSSGLRRSARHINNT